MTLERFDIKTGKRQKIDLTNRPTLKQIIAKMRRDQEALDRAVADMEDRIKEIEAWIEKIR